MKTGCLPRLSKVAAMSVRLFMMMMIRRIHNVCLHCRYKYNEKRPTPHTIVKICVLHFKILLYDVCLLIFDCKKRLKISEFIESSYFRPQARVKHVRTDILENSRVLNFFMLRVRKLFEM